MKIAVFGATGMLGCYSALALKRAGHCVVAIGRRMSDNGFFSDYSIQYIGGVSLECAATFADLPTDIDAVVHLAGAMPAHGDASPMPYVQSIVVGMVNCLEWMRTKTNARRIVFNTTPSDVCALFGKPIPVDDDAARSFPKDGGDHAVYAICKNAAVDILEHYKIAHGFQPLVFRHLTVYGWHPSAEYHINGETRVLPWRQIVRKALRGDEIEVWGDPLKKKELLYVDDFTDAIVKAVGSDACGMLNLPGFRAYSLEEQIDGIIGAYCPKGKVSRKVYRKDKPSTPENLLKGEKAHKLLGWKAVVEWDEACRRMCDESRDLRFEKIWGGPSPVDVAR